MIIEECRHAFVTGGASGIGLGIAEALADRGVCVTIADVDAEAAARAEASRPDRFFAVSLDVRDLAGWRASQAAAAARFGPIDILVNNAGVSFDGLEIVDTPPEAFGQVLAINLMGVFNGVAVVGPGLRERRRGHIVNTASVMGLLPGLSGMGAYSASKSAVVALSEALRAEMKPYGVGVSVLCPGLVTSNLRANTVKLGGVIRNAERAAAARPTEMSARAAGEIVVNGVADDLPYLLTHLEHLDRAAQRVEAIRRSCGAIRSS
jgi:NAD(P)-dependent dehydrogenase (short-subunit alcohol dehydrogenase family)